MTSATDRRVTSPPSPYISASMTSTAGSSTLAISAVDPGGIALAENGERLIGGLCAIEVEHAAHQGAGTPAEKDTDGPTEDADEHSDQRAARNPDGADVVVALGDNAAHPLRCVPRPPRTRGRCDPRRRTA